MSIITEKGSLALSALNITNFNKSISDEILLDKETGLFYYNLKNDENETMIKNTLSVDLMNRISDSLSKIDNFINKFGGSDYKVILMNEFDNADYKPFIINENKVIRINGNLISNYVDEATQSIMVFIDSFKIQKFVNKIDLQQIPIVPEISINNGNSPINRIGNLDLMNMYNINDFKSDNITITISNIPNSNSDISIYGIYFILL